MKVMAISKEKQQQIRSNKSNDRVELFEVQEKIPDWRGFVIDHQEILMVYKEGEALLVPILSIMEDLSFIEPLPKEG